jgi:hypothetical protein
MTITVVVMEAITHVDDNQISYLEFSSTKQFHLQTNQQKDITVILAMPVYEKPDYKKDRL